MLYFETIQRVDFISMKNYMYFFSMYFHSFILSFVLENENMDMFFCQKDLKAINIYLEGVVSI